MTDVIKYSPAPRAVARVNLWRDGLTAAVVTVARIVGTLAAAVLLLAGLILFPLPIPLGLPCLALGGFLMWQSCPPARGFARTWLAAHPGVFRRVHGTLARFRIRRGLPQNRDF